MKALLNVGKIVVLASLLVLGLNLTGCSKPSPEQIAERTELLFESIGNNDVEMVKQCIKTGANVNAEKEFGYRDEPYTPLIYAIQHDSVEIVDLLIKAKADVNHKDPSHKFSPVVWALRSENSSVRKSMIELLAKNNSDVNSGFFYAARWPVTEEDLKLLKKLGANINAKDEEGWTPLMYAASVCVDQYVIILANLGADLNAKNNDGETALTIARNSHNWSKDSTVSLLKSLGAKE